VEVDVIDEVEVEVRVEFEFDVEVEVEVESAGLPILFKRPHDCSREALKSSIAGKI
jgi:hypothetical protein